MSEILPSSEATQSAREVYQRGYEAGAREMKEKIKSAFEQVEYVDEFHITTNVIMKIWKLIEAL